MKNLGVDASLLAEPIVLIRPLKKVKIQVGAEIPYPSVSKDGNQNTIFKFDGLKLALELKKEGDGFLLDYSAEITKPNVGGEISGSKESASARVSIIKPIELFEINFQTKALEKDSLPVMGSIPLFGKLFSNSKNSKTYKKITGLVMLEEV